MLLARKLTIHNFLLIALLIGVFIGFNPFPTSASQSISGGVSDGNFYRQIFFGSIIFTIAILAIRSGDLSYLRMPNNLSVLYTFAALSIIWSIDPSVSFRRFFLSLIVALSVTYLIRNIGNKESMRIISNFLLFVLCLNIVLVYFIDGAVHGPGEIDALLEGNWRGVFEDKNTAGAVAALSILIFIVSPTFTNHAIRVVAIILGLVFLYGTKSKTSIYILPITISVGFIIKIIPRNTNILIITISAVGAIFSSLLFFYSYELSQLVLVLDNPAGFTGRSQIWSFLFGYIAHNPLLGSGYGSMWQIGDSSPIVSHSSGWLTGVSHGHNGYLDIIAQFGLLIGTILIFIMIVIPIYKALSGNLSDNIASDMIFIFIFFALHNLLETTMLGRAEPVWVIFLLAFLILENSPRNATIYPSVKND